MSTAGNYHPSRFEHLLGLCGIQFKQIPKLLFPYSNSPFATKHLVKEEEFLCVGLLSDDERAHEMGHLVVWDLLGRPEADNFGCQTETLDERGDFEEGCRQLIKGHGYWPFMIYEKPIYPYHKNWSMAETPACAIEAAIMRRTRKSRRGAYAQLRYENFIQDDNSRKEGENIVTMMLDFGERLLRQHAELLEERTCKSS